MNIKTIGHWLGDSISSLPEDVRTTIQNHFTVVEHEHDISILSAPNLKVAFFYMKTSQQQNELIIALKICENLNKQLIIVHNNLFHQCAEWCHVIKAVIDLSKNHTQRQTDELLRSLSNSSNHHEPETIADIAPDITPAGHLSAEQEKSLFDILHYIDHNLDTSLREDDISAYFHYTPSYFSKLFRQATGIGFRDYVCRKRIERAQKLLQTHKENHISQIAYQCGYRDVSYFSRLFKKITGTTPSEYRQRFFSS
ncbi:helix-turn-helix transcriptional regulator [Vibrio mangrovi]|uniref:Helix-turn-helix transcriptional regulator n=1 Tax=Vibrio mangrovi TaxID=474394 RepID=A0A1Y6IYL2_9VIBR|nr:helix-turn-helix domain-containing protein [Vibrio mangrovi]MDW6002373.1 helix-turn-helix transcriptional regulator [Vibrio mangrovi]SMS02728.1 Transposon Tn10 TetD protein [Vibrio mangrovi]